jgi:hypothetical protein
MCTYRKLLFFFFCMSSVSIYSKPPFPHVARNINALNYTDLDYQLKAHPMTILDFLQEDLEDFTLTSAQKDFLNNLQNTQNSFINSIQKIYLARIQAIIDDPEEFYKTRKIYEEIEDYKNEVEEDSILLLEIDIEQFCFSLTENKETISDGAQRRQRLE